ncbi:MAG: hypothetical protein NTW05_11400 [Pseudonocardiales bacterium]|jgi:hypothetical protein|nr:hypothetical protein [Pseudonocardiales bacterium]
MTLDALRPAAPRGTPPERRDDAVTALVDDLRVVAGLRPPA